MAPNSVSAPSSYFSPPPPPMIGQPRVVGAALVNLGNTCFLNAVLQCLTHTVPLVQMIRKTDHSASHHGDDAGFCSFCALKAHINGCLFLSRLVVSPTYLAQNLSKISPHFRLGQQEDAHEFLHSFLDNMHARCLGRTADDRPASLEEDSIVKQVFGGRLRSQLRCCSCGHCSDTFEPLLDLSLEIENVRSVGDALESFTKLERIDDPEVRFTCDGCKAQVSMEKQLKLDQAPQVLALHLKRFKNDGSYSNKIDDFVEYPLELDLNPCLSCPAKEVQSKYDLYAVLVHVGSALSGHYFCYIRSSPSTWHQIDDSQVVSVSESDALEQQAYVFFYVRRGSSCWFSNFMEEEKALDVQAATGTSPASVLEHAERYSASSSGSANACSSSRGTPERNEDAGPCNNASPLSPVPDGSRVAKRQACHARTPPRTFNQWHGYESDDEPPEDDEDDDLLPLYKMEFKATKGARKPAALPVIKKGAVADRSDGDLSM